MCGYEPFYSGENEAEMYKKILKADYKFDPPFWNNISENAKVREWNEIHVVACFITMLLEIGDNSASFVSVTVMGYLPSEITLSQYCNSI